ncbi:hypothetical protein KF913_17340, partial [Candidatus Obscuribacterales bacterium]|nr:hypothetical protein [Candidatus Obscuribacterales bacterium]
VNAAELIVVFVFGLVGVNLSIAESACSTPLNYRFSATGAKFGKLLLYDSLAKPAPEARFINLFLTEFAS